MRTDDERSRPARPPRLTMVHVAHPLYYVTFCAWQRRGILANAQVREALEAFAVRNADRGVAVGRYVIMPDHVHLFMRLAIGFRLTETVRLLKRALSKALNRAGRDLPHWQPGFFDHVLRSDESYAAKWNYVRDNPVRKELVKCAEEWPYQGEPVRIDCA